MRLVGGLLLGDPMPSPPPKILTENELEAFRAEHLHPDSVLRMIEKTVQLLLRLPVGVGKTHAAVDLLLSPKLYQRFDLVLYAAPAWNILKEVTSSLEDAGLRRWKVLEPRPMERCGGLDAEWQGYEKRGCSTLAKKRVCESLCPHYSECPWPNQLKRLKRIRLFLLTEQRIGLIRSIVDLLRKRASRKRVLVILDEARLLDIDLEVSLSREEIEVFREAVRDCRSGKPVWRAVQKAWIEGMNALLTCETSQDLRDSRLPFPRTLHNFAYRVQDYGWERYRQAFRYSGWDLSLLGRSLREERWVDGDEFRFIGRPLLDCHLLLLSAHLTSDYVGHRLGVGTVTSPFEDVRFLHSGTRVVNLRNGSGAARHFERNRKQILDTFAVLIARNRNEGQTTVLVSRKKFKDVCAKYLRHRLAGWGFEVEFVTDGYEKLPAPPNPSVIPIIHYGILGVNDFTSYEVCYCLNSYYVNGGKLNSSVQEFEPRHFRIQLEIVRGPDRIRRVRIADPELPDEDRIWLAEVYLRKLEVDPVIQAVGRCRYTVRPREVVFFQMNDMEGEVGELEEVRSLADLRRSLQVPAARQIDDFLEGREARAWMDAGGTAEDGAKRMEMSRRTFFRRLQSFESAKSPLKDFLRESGTPPGLSGPPEGVAGPSFSDGRTCQI